MNWGKPPSIIMLPLKVKTVDCQRSQDSCDLIHLGKSRVVLGDWDGEPESAADAQFTGEPNLSPHNLN
jgi:hypothetical protein